jgi:hypothetical protein
MIELTIFRRGHAPALACMPAVPRPGDYLECGGLLWRVADVVYSLPATGSTLPSISIFAIEVAGDRRQMLTRLWSAWPTSDGRGDELAELVGKSNSTPAGGPPLTGPPRPCGG